MLITVAPGNASDAGSSTDGGGASVRYFPWANPENIMTKDMSDGITEALQCYVFPVVTVFGVVGNILSLIVLSQKKLRSSTTSVVLIGLAFSDLIFLLANAFRKSTCIIKKFDMMAADTLNATTFFYMFYLKTAFSRVSTLLVVLISVERLIAVAFPLKVKTIVTKGRMIVAVVICYVIALGALSLLPPQYTYIYIMGKPYISMTKFATENADPLKAYNEYFLPIAFRHVPVVVVFILNTIIVILLGRSKRFQKSSVSKDSKRSDDQKRVTRMLLSVAIVFLICLLPGDVLLIASLAIDGFMFFGKYHNLFLAVSDICLLFEMLNSCGNFIIYIVLNKNFYDMYMQLFCCCILKIRSRDESSKSFKTSKVTGETSLGSKLAATLNMQEHSSVVVDDEDAKHGIEVDQSNGHDNKAFEDN